MSTINNITKLRFFSDNGIELYTLKDYTITWKLVPCDECAPLYKEIPHGYFISDVKNIIVDGKLINRNVELLEAYFINPGKLYLDKVEYSFDTEDIAIAQCVLDNFYHVNNKIEICVKQNNTNYTKVFNINTIFDYAVLEEMGWTTIKEFYGENTNDYYTYITLSELLLRINEYADENLSDKSYLYQALTNNIENLGFLFPFVTYLISLYQDNISANFLNVSTILILQEEDNGEFVRPYLSGTSVAYQLLFATTKDTELHLLEVNDMYEVTYHTEKYFSDLFTGSDKFTSKDPVAITVGTISDTEGCYQNYLGIYLRSNNNELNTLNDFPYFIGAISVKCEVIGEDERFRTLLTNFGIPDPITYSNIFAEQEYDEELQDYQLINKKSKELFLTYTDIFSYVGTYKALINAIKFLGYNDIVFKEWYKILDNNDLLRDIAVLVIDISEGKFLLNTLSEYGISIEDYLRYNKLNRLSMIYHLNRINELKQEDEVLLYEVRPTGIYNKFYDIVKATKFQIENNINLYNQLLQEVTNIFLTYCTDIDNNTDKIDLVLLSYNIDVNEIEDVYNNIKTVIADIENNKPTGFHVSSDYTEYYRDNIDGTPIKNVNNTWNAVETEETEEGKNHKSYNLTPWQIVDINTVDNILTYRNNEIIAKLYSVKKWLERHIIGVNAYIHDITGEGICLHYVKTQGYVTLHDMDDFYTEAYYTPDIHKISEFIDSSAILTCTLNEFNGLTFDDYDKITFNSFTKKTIDIDINDKDYKQFFNLLLISNSIECPVLGDEYQFELNVNPTSSTLYEFTDSTKGTLLYLNDGEITLLDDNSKESVINQKNNPIISLEIANIRKCFGKWTDNIEYSVREIIDLNTGNTKYELNNIGNRVINSHYITNSHIRLIPGDDAKFMYSDHNKWHLPMLIISGYKFDYDSILLTQDDKEFEIYDIENHTFILDIIKGLLLFNNNAEHIRARVNFSDIFEKYEGNSIYNEDISEQMIKVFYSYDSERIPFTTVNIEQLEDDINNIEVSLNSNIDKTELINKLLEDSLPLLNNEFNTELSKNELTEYKGNLEYNNDIQLFIDTCEKADKIKNQLINLFSLYENNYNFNRTIDTSVHHLGDYTVTVKAFDRYNNIFVNKSDKYYTLECLPISYNITVDLNNSNNNDNFYQYNKDGETIKFNTISKHIENTPLFPKTYGIYDITSNNSNTIKYDVISYALDVPKKNDYFVCNNLTEMCTGVNDVIVYSASMDKSNDTVKINMLDENPLRLNLYIKDTSVNICIYDVITQTDVSIGGPYKVLDFNLLDAATDDNYSDLSFIILDSNNAGEIILSYEDEIRNGAYCAYMINVTEYPISIYNKAEEIIEYNYENDYDNNLCYITFENCTDLYFNKNDVIKVSYYKFIDDAPENAYIVNECAYRISESYIEEENYIIILDGIIDDILIKEHILVDKVTISYPYRKPIHYTVRVSDDGSEYALLDRYQYYKLVAEFNYNNLLLFLNSYLDNTFNGYVYEYDIINLKKIWENINSSYDDEVELFNYLDYPITINPEKLLLIYPDFDDSSDSGSDNDAEDIKPAKKLQIFKNLHKVIWKWYATTFDDNVNWNEHINTYTKELLFKSINRCLSIKPTTLGPNYLELTCIDDYGNTVTTVNNGKIFIEK